MTTEDLMSGLFQNIHQTQESLTQQQVLPNFQGGYDIRESDGSVAVSINPSVDGSSTIIGDSGMAEGHIREGVGGETIYDFGAGETVTARETITGGEVFQNDFGQTIGYSEPSFMGEMDYEFNNGASFTVTDNPIGEGLTIDSHVSPSLPEFESFADPGISSFEGFHEIGTVMDTLDFGATAVEGTGIFDMISELL
ncbi:MULTISPECIES: hypothetical protein [Sediminibacillus]|uniref:hypothetical protein n=1 Tax=Sediminibacillus TaxID=482460 RepID=UPI000479C64D|nr:hypothetical protein [Sediminibacillus terrae]